MSPVTPPTSCKPIGNIWTFENRISSDSETKEACIPGLPEDAMELISRFVKVDGQALLRGIFRHEPFQPDSKVTTDGFDQVLLYHNLYSLQIYLSALGFNINHVLGTKHGGKPHPIVAHANGTDSLNAWYSPQNDSLTFGTANGTWHLASDSDVSTHEAGHMILDHYHPGLTGWFSNEGGAIHEGYADALAAGYFDDPEMSEDFVPMKGRPESKEDGLRIVDNDLTLDDVSGQVHDRGRVYSGFFWSIKKALMDPAGPFNRSSREAADLMLKLAINHGANYKTSRPTSKDFVEAVLAGVDSLQREGRLPVDAGTLKSTIIREAFRRKLFESVKDLMVYETEFRSLDEVVSHLERQGSPSRFYKAHEAEFIGGTFELHQQRIDSERYGSIDVVGHGILIQRDSTGKIVSLSARDAVPVRRDEIDESGTVTPTEAIKRALDFSRDEYLRVIRLPVRNGSVDGMSKKQMEYQIALSDQENLKRIQSMLQTGGEISYKVVLIDDKSAPQYEFKAGLSIYYVDTVSGGVTRYDDVIVN